MQVEYQNKINILIFKLLTFYSNIRFAFIYAHVRTHLFVYITKDCMY